MTSNRFPVNSPQFLRPKLKLIKNNCISYLSSHEYLTLRQLNWHHPAMGQSLIPARSLTRCLMIWTNLLSCYFIICDTGEQFSLPHIIVIRIKGDNDCKILHTKHMINVLFKYLIESRMNLFLLSLYLGSSCSARHQLAERLPPWSFELPYTLLKKKSQKSLVDGICYCGSESQIYSDRPLSFLLPFINGKGVLHSSERRNFQEIISEITVWCAGWVDRALIAQPETC